MDNDRPLVAVVGGDTLLAKEVRDVLASAQPAPRTKLISATAAPASAAPAAGPVSVPSPAAREEAESEDADLIPLSLESLEGSSVAFLAGSPASSRRALKLVNTPHKDSGEPAAPLKLIDLTGALEEQPHARLRAPIAEPLPDPAALRNPAPIQVIAHPAAIVLAKFLSTVARCTPVRSAHVHIFEPASERGRRGIEELQKQTVSVLNFQKLKTDVFDAQLAFNMLARYGEEAEEPLEGVEQRIERDLASLLAAWPGVSMPSLRLVQAPVFHGHSFSVWLEFESNPGTKQFSKALVDELERAGFDVRPDDPPSNIGVAERQRNTFALRGGAPPQGGALDEDSGISVGAISPDRNNSRAFWFWLVSDNLRLTAENAVAVAQEIL